MRWETQRAFDGKLCQEYSYQKLSNVITGFQVTTKNVGMFFLGDIVYFGYGY